MSAVAQSGLQCPHCGGQRFYDPTVQGLRCTQCDQTERLYAPEEHSAAEERDVDLDEDRPVSHEVQVHHCQTCGGDVIFTGAALSERCAYCDGPVVLRQSDESYRTMALIPFRVAEDAAQTHAQDWVHRRFAAPNDLSGIVGQGRVAGLYAPFWTFDSEEAVRYWAKYSVRRNKRTVTKRVSGDMRISFDDLLAPASPHVTPLIRDGILHEFDPDNLHPYAPGYLAGFAAEQHHQSVAEGLKTAEADKDLLIRNRIKRHIGKSGVRDIKYQKDTSGLRYRRILLPVWMLHYVYKGQPMKVVVCGIHGRTFGERPFSVPKLFGYAAILTAAVMAFGLFWGVSAAP